MGFQGKHFLKLLDFSAEEIGQLIDLAASLKEKKKQARARAAPLKQPGMIWAWA